MEFKAKRSDFLATLYWTQGIVERRNTMPILANVLIESRSGKIYLTATDLEVGIRGTLEGEVARDGVVTVGAKKLYEIVREAPEEMLQVKRLENDWVEIKSGKSVFKIVGLDAREFPQFPKFEGEKLSSVPAKVLREMIERTIFSVSKSETPGSSGSLLNSNVSVVPEPILTNTRSQASFWTTRNTYRTCQNVT